MPHYMLNALLALDAILPYQHTENRALFEKITVELLAAGFHPHEFINGIIELIKAGFLTPSIIERMQQFIVRDAEGHVQHSAQLNTICHCIAGLAHHDELTRAAFETLLARFERSTSEQLVSFDNITPKIHSALSARVQERIFTCHPDSFTNLIQVIFPTLASETCTERTFFLLLDPKIVWLLSDAACTLLWKKIPWNKPVFPFSLLRLVEIVGTAHERGEIVTVDMLQPIIDTPNAPFPEIECTNPYQIELDILDVDDVPTEYKCPISHQIMHDPVQIVQGKPPYLIADRKIIVDWVIQVGKHPYTQKPIEIENLEPATKLKAEIDAFMERSRTAVARRLTGLFPEVLPDSQEIEEHSATNLPSNKAQKY